MNEKVLPMKYPPITSYHTHADLLSVVLNDENNITWLYNHYIQIYSQPIMNDGPDFKKIDFYHPFNIWKDCPFVFYQRVRDNVIKKKYSSIINFIIDCIDMDYYVYLFYDRFYINRMLTYQKYHVIHDMFIYGYKKETQKIYVTEYYDGNAYQYFEIDFNELEESYKNKSICFAEGMEHDEIILLSYKKNKYIKHDLNVPKIIQSLKDYLNAENTNDRVYLNDWVRDHYQRGAVAYGIKVYDHINYYLNTYLHENVNLFDLRPLHVLNEHKKIMLMRILHLGKLGYINHVQSIYTSFKNIVQMSEKVEALHTKLAITKNYTLITKIVNYIEMIRTSEKIVLEYLLENIDVVEGLFNADINENLEDYPFPIHLSVKEFETVLLSNIIPLNLQPSELLSWRSENSANVKIDNCDSQNSLVSLLKHEKVYLQGINCKGEIKAICNIDVVKPGLRSNFNYQIDYKGWEQVDNGVIGKGTYKFILFDELAHDYIYEFKTTMLTKDSTSVLVTHADKFLKRWCNVVLDSASGSAVLWINGVFPINVPAGIKEKVEYAVRAILRDSKIKVYINDVLIIEYDENYNEMGYFGILITGESIFQDINVYPLNDEMEKDTFNPVTKKIIGRCGRMDHEGAHYF